MHASIVTCIPLVPFSPETDLEADQTYSHIVNTEVNKSMFNSKKKLLK